MQGAELDAVGAAVRALPGRLRRGVALGPALVPALGPALALAGLLLAGAAGEARALSVRLDFSLDAGGLFDDPAARTALEAAAGVFEGFADTLDAIVPGGGNTWEALFFDPGTGNVVSVGDLAVGADEVIVFAGGRNLPGAGLGEGGPGGFQNVSGSQDFVLDVTTRGQAGVLSSPASDFGPWGGSIAFDTGTPWHFGLDAAGLGAGEFDFFSVALHELAHLFGFGTSAVWDAFVSGGSFTGPAASAEHGGAVPLDGALAHFAAGTTNGGQETLMDPDFAPGTRKLPTALDAAVFADLGWENTNALGAAAAATVPEAERALLVCGALLLLVGVLTTRRAGPTPRGGDRPPPLPAPRRGGEPPHGLPRSRGSAPATG